MYLAQLVLALCEAEIDEDMRHGKKCKKNIKQTKPPQNRKQTSKQKPKQPTNKTVLLH